MEHELFPKFLLSDLFFRFTADPAAIAEAETEIKAEAEAQEQAGATQPVVISTAARRTRPNETRVLLCRAASGTDMAEDQAPTDGAVTVPADGATGSPDEKSESAPTTAVRAGFVQQIASRGCI